jgi:hypothetical protein
MNSVVFLEWFENQLMPALKNPSLVVLDNASYHNVKTEDMVCPNISQKKAVLQNYLTLRLSPTLLSVYPRFMRARVSLDFDILIESFISLCIIETIGAIFREYKPWIALLITQ